MSRESMHVDPIGATETARHYIRDVVYGANDGLITTFAVVGGVTRGALSPVAVIVIGAANLGPTAFRWASGTCWRYEPTSERVKRPRCRNSKPIRGSTVLATTFAFVVAGTVRCCGTSFLESRADWSGRRGSRSWHSSCWAHRVRWSPSISGGDLPTPWAGVWGRINVIGFMVWARCWRWRDQNGAMPHQRRFGLGKLRSPPVIFSGRQDHSV
ncbi:MAG TPA: VIT1/CCC1 transporter family protein [Vicinamibacterales bacterium]